MSEISTGDPQFVGEADATKPMSEAPPTKEFELNIDQQQVLSAMDREGKILEVLVARQRAKAGKKLKTLHGKELVEAGTKQMAYGVIETVKNEAKEALIDGLAGAGIAGMLTLARGHNSQLASRNLRTGAQYGALIGLLTGYGKAGIEYNRGVAREKHLPPARLFDWATSLVVNANIGLVLELTTLPRPVKVISSQVLTQILNPITMGRIRNITKGFLEMGIARRDAKAIPIKNTASA